MNEFSKINFVKYGWQFQSHPDVIKAGKDALDEYGAGLSSVRFICGTQKIHKVYFDSKSYLILSI